MNSDLQTEREILAAHAEQLNTGLRGTTAYPPMSAEQRFTLAPLLQLAELLADVLILVQGHSARPGYRWLHAFVGRVVQVLPVAPAGSAPKWCLNLLLGR
jgi:hypothetical protein